MSKKSGGALLSMLQLHRDQPAPLYRQLETELRRLILAGDLGAGLRLPSSRQLALDLGISRLTVKNVFEQLTSEGFLKAARGAGTYVARISASELRPRNPVVRADSSFQRQQLSERAAAVAGTAAITRLEGFRAFRPGVPALDLFPRKIWAATYSRVLRQGGGDIFSYGPVGGLPGLRRSIAEHIRDLRGVCCEPEQIIVTAGAQQAFALAAFTLLNPHDVAWCEDPGHIAGRDALTLFGVRALSVPLDSAGFKLHHALNYLPGARLIFVTPSHQHPLGMTLSLERRMQMIEYARRNEAWIVEDDYDSEYRYVGRAIPALQSLDRYGRVIYIGSFSKSLFPGLRIGYLVAPPGLVDTFAAGQSLLSQNVSPVSQEVLRRFIDDGAYHSHIRRMKLVYQERQDRLLNALEELASDLFEASFTDAGMHTVAWLRDGRVSDQSIARKAWAAGVDCLPVSIYCDQEKIAPALMLGFACAGEEEIRGRVEQLAMAVRKRT